MSVVRLLFDLHGSDILNAIAERPDAVVLLLTLAIKETGFDLCDISLRISIAAVLTLEREILPVLFKVFIVLLDIS